MFKCGKCGKTTTVREPQAKVIVETRIKHYDNGGVGSEIVKEISICQLCATGRKYVPAKLDSEMFNVNYVMPMVAFGELTNG